MPPGINFYHWFRSGEYYSGDFKPHITPCLSGALLVELISPNIVWSPPGETHACKMVLVSVMGRNTRAGSDLVGSAIVSSTHNTIYRQHTAPPAYRGASWWHLLNLKQDWRCRMYNDSPRSLSGTTINSGLKVIFNLERKPWVLIVCLINTGTGVKWTEQNRPHSLIFLTNYTAQTLAGDHL